MDQEGRSEPPRLQLTECRVENKFLKLEKKMSQASDKVAKIKTNPKSDLGDIKNISSR